MSAEARAAILSRIRAANRISSAADNRAQREQDWTALPRNYRAQGMLSEAERLQLFDERIRHYNGTPFYSTADIPADIAKILSERGKRNLLVPPGLPGEWLPQGFHFTRDENLTKEQLNAFDGVITGCTVGIALTGTVVLESSPEQGRRAATLIPDYHLCVLRKDDIVELVPEAIRRLEGIKEHPLTFFSGPSATVDIEMTRVRGVHGPRTLDILLI
jgi:L-lactate dehydrogenase complex protein LldG